MWVIPSTSSPCSAEAGCTTKQSAQPCQCSDSITTLWVTLNGKPQRRDCSWHAWKTRGYSQRLFGAMTSPVWTPDLCGDSLTSSLPARHASHIRQRGSVAALKMSVATAEAECSTDVTRCATHPEQSDQKASSQKRDGNVSGQASSSTPDGTLPCPTQSASSMSVDPPWSGSKMFRSGLQAGLFSDSEKNYQTWVTSSKARSLSLRRTLERHMNVNAFSSWLTPHGATGDHGPDGSECAKQAKDWATPNANERGPELDKSHRPNAGGIDLQSMASNWPSPRSETDSKGAGPATTRACGKSREDQLAYAANAFPSSHPDAMTTDDGLKSLLQIWTRPSNPRLNPAFQWWLMGWPLPASFYESAATAWSHYRQQLHFAIAGFVRGLIMESTNEPT